MSKADPLSAGLKSVGGRLVGLFLLMALPSLGRLIDVLSSGNYSYLPGALGGIIGCVRWCMHIFLHSTADSSLHQAGGRAPLG
jgi:hypothetical protein